MIEALELTLGTTMTEYLCVSLDYRHSAFPEQTSATERTQTTLTTTVTATINRDNPGSPWSPRCPQPSREPNPLFEIIASYWGADAAADLSRRIYFPANPVNPARSSQSPRNPKPALRLLPTLMIPKRKGSLRRCLRSPAGVQDPHNIIDEETERQNDRAKKIWSQIRRMSSVGGDNGDSDEGDRTVSPGPMRVSTSDLRDETEQQRKRTRLRERALANRHSMGGEVLRDFVPPPRDTKENRPTTGMAGGTEQGYEKQMGMRAGVAVTSLSSRERRDRANNRWWGSDWWQ